jgi:hypothetical protein
MRGDALHLWAARGRTTGINGAGTRGGLTAIWPRPRMPRLGSRPDGRAPDLLRGAHGILRRVTAGSASGTPCGVAPLGAEPGRDVAAPVKRGDAR